MKTLTENDIKELIQNGALMPIESEIRKFNITSYVGNGIPLGYPVGIEEFNSRLSPEKLFMKNPKSLTGKVYIVPNGLLELNNFENNEQALQLLKSWNSLTAQYWNNNYTIRKNDKEILNSMLKTYREIVYICLKDNLAGKSLLDEELLIYYIGGKKYLRNLSSEQRNELLNNEITDTYFANLIQSKEDIVNFENQILSLTKSTKINDRNIGIKKYDMPGYLYKLWQYINNHYFKNGPYDNPDSLFLNHYKNYLDNYKLTNAPTIEIVQELEKFTIDSSKEILIYLFNTSEQKAVVKYLEKYLTKHNVMPTVKTDLLLSSKSKTIYQNTVQFNYSLIKQAVENNPTVSQRLINMIGECFKKEEKDCYRCEWNFLPEEGLVEFSIESLNEQITEKLSKKMNIYVECAIKTDLLNEIKDKLINYKSTIMHSQEIIDVYLRYKNMFLLKENLEDNLDPRNRPQKIKKI